MADTGDRLMDLADKLAAALAAAYTSVSIDGTDHSLTVAWQDNPHVELEDADLLAPLLWVVDIGETLDERDGMNFEDIELLVVLQMKLNDQSKAAVTVRALSKLMNDIARTLRPIDDAYYLELDDGGAPCVKAVRKPARDLKDWATRGRYYAEIVTIWRRY